MDSYGRPEGTTAAGAKTDQTLGVGSESGSGSGAWSSPSGSPPPSAFLYPAFDTCASDTSDVDPSLLRFTRFPHLLRYSSPPPEKPPGARRLLQMKSAIGSGKLPPPLQLLLKSPASHKATPIRMAGMEEDVLVMDGVLVTDTRPNIGRNNSAEFGSSGNSSSSRSSVLYKRGLVRVRLKRIACVDVFCSLQSVLRFDAHFVGNLQFALGKEDLWCPRSWKQKNEVRIFVFWKYQKNKEFISLFFLLLLPLAEILKLATYCLLFRVCWVLGTE